MNPNGRPPLPQKKRRTSKSILVRFNEDEAKAIDRAVTRAKLLPSVWARAQLLEGAK